MFVSAVEGRINFSFCPTVHPQLVVECGSVVLEGRSLSGLSNPKVKTFSGTTYLSVSLGRLVRRGGRLNLVITANEL